MLVDELGMAVAAQEHAEIIEPGYNALQLDPIDQKNGEGCLALTYVIEKRVLKVLRTFRRHFHIRLFRRYVHAPHAEIAKAARGVIGLR